MHALIHMHNSRVGLSISYSYQTRFCFLIHVKETHIFLLYLHFPPHFYMYSQGLAASLLKFCIFVLQVTRAPLPQHIV